MVSDSEIRHLVVTVRSHSSTASEYRPETVQSLVRTKCVHYPNERNSSSEESSYLPDNNWPSNSHHRYYPDYAGKFDLQRFSAKSFPSVFLQVAGDAKKLISRVVASSWVSVSIAK